VKCTAWGKTAQIITDILQKGDKVFLVGRVEAPELFTRRDGQQGLAEKFTVEAFEKLSKAQEQQQEQEQEQAAPASAAGAGAGATRAAAPPVRRTAAPAPASAPQGQQPPAGGYDMTRAIPQHEIAAAVAAAQQQPPAGGYEDPPF
jgi:single-stranded DNA-binding protein